MAQNSGTVNTVQTISWARTGTIANAKLEYSTNGGTTYPNIIIASTPAGGLSYSWTIPDSVTTTCKVKLSDASDATVFDESNANFAIRGGFNITAPNGAEIWTVGHIPEYCLDYHRFSGQYKIRILYRRAALLIPM